MVSYFFLGSVGRTFFWIMFLIYVHLSYNYNEIGSCRKGLLIVYGLGYCLCCSVLSMKCFISVLTMYIYIYIYIYMHTYMVQLILHMYFVSGFVNCPANKSQSWMVWKKSSTMMQFTLSEIWKRYTVLLCIRTGSANTKISKNLKRVGRVQWWSWR